MKNETVDLRSQMNYRSQQIFEVFQYIAAIYMGQTQIMFTNFYTRVTSWTAVVRHVLDVRTANVRCAVLSYQLNPLNFT